MQPLRQNRNRVPRRLATMTVLAGAGAILCGPAGAVELEFGNGFRAKLDNELTTGFQVRTQDRSCKVIGMDNGGCVPASSELINLGFAGADPNFNLLNQDSGDLNYTKGDVVSWVLKGTHDLAIAAPDGWSAFVRATWSSDFAADDTDRTDLIGEGKKLTNFDHDLLDAFVSKNFSWFGQDAMVRVGNQVLSWGEDIFIPGGINVINAIDLRRFHTPGTALKEVFVPAPMVSLNTGITENLSAEAYYQFGWNSFQFDTVGTFFSTVDFIGPGPRTLFVPGFGDEASPATAVGLARLSPDIPDDHGQFGANIRYLWGDTELAAYYIRYHDKLPFVGFTPNFDYFIGYGEDRDLFGVSGNTPVSTAWGDFVIGAELSYRPKDSVAIDPTLLASFAAAPVNQRFEGFAEEKRWQGHATAFHLFSPDSPLGQAQAALGATDGYLLAEAAVTHYPGLRRDGTVPYLLPDYSLPDETSFGYIFEVGVTFPHIFGTPINMTPFVDFSHDVSGTTPNAFPFVEDRKSLALNLAFNYLGRVKANVNYVMFWDGGTNNLMQDRDFFGASLSYAF